MNVNDLFDTYNADQARADDFLAHHGVKGMHWGIRKDRESETHRDYRKSSVKSFNKVIEKTVPPSASPKT